MGDKSIKVNQRVALKMASITRTERRLAAKIPAGGVSATME